MSIAFRILYAAYGKGTHHKLALDALNDLQGPSAEAWRRLFLVHAARYAEGSKAPDDVYKDFVNHVLHPRDGYWGGAPKAAADSYGKLLVALKAQDWDAAAFAAGVLSHYVVDPLMPFHTGQSDAENSIHRATEWSINRAYDGLRAEGLRRTPRPTVPAVSGDQWLVDLIKAGAARANGDYERLMAHYDITRGVVDPPAGLDVVARTVVADLLVIAASTFAFVLDRAIAESGVAAPEVDLALPALVAALKIPKAMVLKRLADQADRKIVEAMYDELIQSGKVEINLPADDRAVKERHTAEVLGRKTMPTVIPHDAPAADAEMPRASDPPRETAATTPVANREPARGEVRVRLSLADDLEAAPSIGPKTAERFAAIGIKTVGDFLACDVEATAKALDRRGMEAATLALWQSQTKLVLNIAGLSGTQARLLSGAGYLTADAIATADVATLCADVLRYAASGPGQQILRDATPPDATKIAQWVANARAA